MTLARRARAIFCSCFHHLSRTYRAVHSRDEWQIAKTSCVDGVVWRVHAIRPMAAAESWTKTLLAPARFALGPREVKLPLLVDVVARVLKRKLEPIRRSHFERLREAVAARRAPRFEDAGTLLQSVSRRSLEHAQDRNVPLILHCACRRVFVRETFSEALFHLLDNAILANRPGHPVILDVRDEKDGHVWQIHDMGLGMVPSVLAKLGDAGEDDAGLGVAIANAIIQEHQGVLSYESGAGVGTTATVWVPTA